jgi:DNA-binding transcriptional MocR family regulator
MSDPRMIAREARARYDAFKKAPVSLDITRGKPSAEQLDLSNELLAILKPSDFRAADGTDCRNYGGLEGLPEMRALFGAIFEVPAAQVVVGDNASLTLMYETLALAMAHGVPGGAGAWSAQKPRFLCPSPGYDRHFAICEDLGIEMILVPYKGRDPDMEMVERLVKSDPRIKGMWLVPKYNNPTGTTLSDECVRALAKMECAAPDFRIIWDNAYVVHHLSETPDALLSGYAAGVEASQADRFVLYSSFSKVTLAGAGVSAMAGSKANMDWLLLHRSKATIGPDKVNQLRHVRFLKDLNGVTAHMRKHAAILKPKFEMVERILKREIGDTGLATWTKPNGGYFVSLDTKPGQAARVCKMAAEAGLKLTPAGSAFPYRKDPQDQNIRIAPSFPPLAELEKAMEILSVAVLCSAEA